MVTLRFGGPKRQRGPIWGSSPTRDFFLSCGRVSLFRRGILYRWVATADSDR